MVAAPLTLPDDQRALLRALANGLRAFRVKNASGTWFVTSGDDATTGYIVSTEPWSCGCPARGDCCHMALVRHQLGDLRPVEGLECLSLDKARTREQVRADAQRAKDQLFREA